MRDSDQTLDRDELAAFQLRLFSKLEGAFTAGMVHLGDRLGLYTCLAGGDAQTAAALAASTGLHERWVREWVYNQAAAGLLVADVDTTPGSERFSLSPEAAAVLATPDDEVYGAGRFHDLPQMMAALESLPESFRTGIGRDFDSHGREGAISSERTFDPWYRAHLVRDVLPALDGVVDALADGIDAADLGCGAGGATLILGEAFPASTITGYDISNHALERSKERRAERGLGNVRFVDPRDHPLPERHFGLIMSFDCLHDMTDPHGMAKQVRASLADDGTWLLVDIKSRETFAENVVTNPMAPLLYGISVMACLASSMSEPGGAGLGTLGLTESTARQIATGAGFTRFRRLDIEHPINAFYEIRP